MSAKFISFELNPLVVMSAKYIGCQLILLVMSAKIHVQQIKTTCHAHTNYCTVHGEVHVYLCCYYLFLYFGCLQPSTDNNNSFYLKKI